MLAVTIGVGDKFALLAELAAATCRRHTGLEVRVLGEDAMARQGVAKPHHLKFRLFRECPSHETLLYFDADTIFLNSFDPYQFRSLSEIVCVRDTGDMGTVEADAKRIGISSDEYFNSGFFVVNRRNHEALLSRAEEIYDQIETPFYDQSALNAARAGLNIPALFLGKEFNHLRFDELRTYKTVNIGHFFKIANRPRSTIRRVYEYWSGLRSADSRAASACKVTLCQGAHEYRRVGHDSRLMRFMPDGSIGAGAGGCERRWELTEDERGLVLWILGGVQPTCALTKCDDGVWRGQWFYHEQMPVELVALPSAL
jgi:hypothetical protein